VSLIVSMAAVAGLLSVMLAFLLACARIWFAMSRDGCCRPGSQSRIRVSSRPIADADRRGLRAGRRPVSDPRSRGAVNIGTLSAFVVICVAVIALRRTRPDAERKFRTPFVPSRRWSAWAFRYGCCLSFRPSPGSVS